jgi:hypothetical protein
MKALIATAWVWMASAPPEKEIGRETGRLASTHHQLVMHVQRAEGVLGAPATRFV